MKRDKIPKPMFTKIYAPLQQNIRAYSLDQATARDVRYALWDW
jgi:hypothetical protein